MEPEIVKLIARVVHADTGRPLAEPTYRVRFFDRDLLGDDRLGESGLTGEGVAEVVCSAADYQTGLLGRLCHRLREQKPDIYVEIVDGAGTAMYRSTVRWNVDPARIDEVTGSARRTIDLGTYRFRKGEGLMDSYGRGMVPPMV